MGARTIGALLALAALAASAVACSGDPPGARRVTLASPERAVDRALSGARQSALEGELDAAEARLRTALARHPRDPLAPVVQLLLARVTLARGEPARAAEIAARVNVSADPTLARTQRVVLGLIAASRRDARRALALLRPLERRLPDRTETADTACALAESELAAGEPGRALRAVAALETLASEGVAWMPTGGLSCDQPEGRLALLERSLGRTEDPPALTATLDALPADSPLRRPIAVRLRALAESRHETSRWLRWLADLPDDTATQAPVAPDTRAPLAIVGVLAPTVGARAMVGASVLRGAQYGLEALDNTRVVPEDEGDTPASAAAAFDRLADQGVQAVIGVTRAELAAAVAIRAQSRGVDVWLLAPARGLDATGARVHAAGPMLEARAAVLADAARGRGARLALLAGADGAELADLVARITEAAGVTTLRVPLEDGARRALAAAGGSNAVVHMLVGAPGLEARLLVAREAERAPSQWIVEARSARPGSAGTWVGVRAGPALTALLPGYCLRVGEPPDELALLAHDAARAAVAALRRAPPLPGALAPTYTLTRATVEPTATVPADAPAAAARCPAGSTELPAREE